MKLTSSKNDRPPYLTDRAIYEFIDAALAEDIGEADYSTIGSIPEEKKGSANLLVKDDGLIAGLELSKKIFQRFDPALAVAFSKKDGDRISKGEVAFTVSGSVRAILSTERVVLNCMQRMSGIATYTDRLCKLIEGTKAQLMDTRKTTPNFRLPEKWAVAIGGGRNHRFALYDMVMLKDNHVDAAGGIANAITEMKDFLKEKGKKLAIEVETRNLSEVQQVIDAGGVDVIMLDNMSIENMKQAVSTIAGRYKTEASGGITESTLRDVAHTGVDFISVGALTHSVKSLDLSLKFVSNQGRG